MKIEDKTIGSITSPDAPAAAGMAVPGVGAYSPQGLFTYDLSTAQWEKEQKEGRHRWKDSPQGRLGIRMFSRGVMGALGFTWGGHFIGAKMAGYNQEKAAENFIQGIAKVIDHGVGKPLEQAVNALGYDGKAFVTFRDTVKFSGQKGMGRSLAQEGLGVSGDFFCMSIGDFWGRKISDMADPNTRKDWINDDGSIDYNKAISRFGKNWWAAVSYSGGEDIAVTLPYIYTMKLGRGKLEKLYPGFAQDFDLNASGGSLKVNDHGAVTGNFSAVGMRNFAERFTHYNIGTLWYREGYNWVGDKIQRWRDTGMAPKIVDENPDNPDRSTGETIVDGVKQFTRWSTRDLVKASLYMVPASLVFGAIRPWQHKFRGYFIHPEKGLLVYGDNVPVRANSPWLDSAFSWKTPVRFSRTGEEAINPFAQGFDVNRTYGTTDYLLQPIAHLNDKAREMMYPVSEWLNRNPDKVYGYTGLKLDPTPEGRRKFAGGHAVTNTYISAAIAYTPYFWAKSDIFAHYWDTGTTDIAIERTLDGAAKLKPQEIAAGLNELWYAVRGLPLPDPEREREAQRRVATDLSPSDNEYDLKRDSHTPHEPVIGMPTKEGFVERLRDHKKQATTRMEDFRKRAEPRSYVEAVGKTPSQEPREAGFAQEVDSRKVNAASSTDFPSAGTTFH